MELKLTLLPVHLKPFEDELISSWIVRLAAGHGLRLHTFSTLVFPGKAMWNRDIDKNVDDEILEILSIRTATPIEKVRETALRHYEGRLYPHHNPLGNTKWIMPIGVYHRMRRKHGLQYCPFCLKEKPYYRKCWRLALSTVCEKHEKVLFNMCINCWKPVNFHRIYFEDGPITKCYHCGIDLSIIKLKLPAPHEDAVIQKDLFKAIESGTIRLENGEIVPSYQYFEVFHQLMKIVSLSPYAQELQDWILPNISLEEYKPFHEIRDFQNSDWFVLPKKGTNIEHLNVYQRSYLKKMVWWLLGEWPERFVSVCKKIGIMSSTLEKDMEPDKLPTWFRQIVRKKLCRYKYTVPELDTNQTHNTEMHDATSST